MVTIMLKKKLNTYSAVTTRLEVNFNLEKRECFYTLTNAVFFLRNTLYIFIIIFLRYISIVHW